MGQAAIVDRAAREARPSWRRAEVLGWLALSAGVAAAWIAVAAVQHDGHPIGWPAHVAHWSVMTMAMMLPTAVPMLVTFRHVVRGRREAHWWCFLAGYVAMWAGYAVAAATLQWSLAVLLGTSHGGAVQGWWAAAVLLGAGLYQFSALKARCLDACVAPMTFLLRHWRDGAHGAWTTGLRHGATCIGCCWALMALAFVGGLATWWFMVLATAVMVVEKLPALHGRTARPIGVVLVVAAALVALFAFIDPGADHPAHGRSLTWPTGASTGS